MANMLAYGVLGGIGGYADGAAQMESYEQRMREQAQMRMDQERLRQQDRLELLTARQSGSGRGGSDGDLSDVFDTNEREKQYRFATGMTADQEAAIRSGDAYIASPPTSRFNADGSSTHVSDEQRMDGWQELQARKVAELDAIRKNVAFGKNAKHAADAESVYQDIGMTEGVRKKDGDYAGLLAKQGKGLYDNEDGGTFNQETGEHKPSPLGQTKAQKERAEGGWYDRRTTNDTSDAEARRDLKEQRVLLTTQINDLAKALEKGQIKSADRKQAEQKLSSLRLRLQKLGADEEPGTTSPPAAPRRLKFNPATGKLE